jgi:hypothetical protein
MQIGEDKTDLRTQALWAGNSFDLIMQDEAY